MKKFMIALLAIAVLFGFAACDNSNGTPDTGDDTTGSALINESVLRIIASEIQSLVENEAPVASLLSSPKIENYADGSYVASFTKAGDADLNKAPTTVTLTVNSFVSDEENATTMKYYLNKFTYAFSTDVIAGDGNGATVSGTLTGYLTLDDTGANEPVMTVSSIDGTPNDVAISTNFGVVMFEEGSISDLTVSNATETVEATDEQIAYLCKYINSLSSGFSAVDQYDKYYDGKCDPAKTELETIVKAIVGSATDSVFKGVENITETDGLVYDVKVDGTTATITVDNGSETALALVNGASEGDPVVQLGSGNVLTITLTGTAGTNTVTNPTAFTIKASKPLAVLDKTTSATEANDYFETVNLGDGITGTIAGATSWTITGSGSSSTKDVGTVAGTFTLATCNVSATTPVGPALEAVYNTATPAEFTGVALTDATVSYQFPAPAAN